MDDSLSGGCFKDFLKYLGILVGPGARSEAWKEAQSKYEECVRFLRSIDAGFVSTIYLYNILAASVLSWVGSFYPPSDELLNFESYALQSLVHGPWNVFPKNLLLQLKLTGLPTQFQCVATNSLASRIRNSQTTSANFADTLRDVHDTLHSEDRNLRVNLPSWLEAPSCIPCAMLWLLRLERALISPLRWFNQISVSNFAVLCRCSICVSSIAGESLDLSVLKTLTLTIL